MKLGAVVVIFRPSGYGGGIFARESSYFTGRRTLYVLTTIVVRSQLSRKRCHGRRSRRKELTLESIYTPDEKVNADAYRIRLIRLVILTAQSQGEQQPTRQK